MDNTSSNESISEVRDILTDVKERLSAFPALDLGYPMGNNIVRPPETAHDLRFLEPSLPNYAAFRAFYELCDGINLPDVGNGIFIHNRQQVATSSARGLPNSLRNGGPIFTFGSDGGGGTFASPREREMCIMHLPVGAVVDGVFDNVRYPEKVIAATFPDFLRRILGDLDAFTSQRTDWQFIA